MRRCGWAGRSSPSHSRAASAARFGELASMQAAGCKHKAACCLRDADAGPGMNTQRWQQQDCVWSAASACMRVCGRSAASVARWPQGPKIVILLLRFTLMHRLVSSSNEV
jgi:hypothetical protein